MNQEKQLRDTDSVAVVVSIEKTEDTISLLVPSFHSSLVMISPIASLAIGSADRSVALSLTYGRIEFYRFLQYSPLFIVLYRRYFPMVEY